MATAANLCDIGVPPEQAKRVGYEQVSVTTTGTTQNSTGGVLKGPGNKIVLVTSHTNTGAVTLPSAAAIGDEIIVVNVSGNTGAIFPPTGGNINGETTDSGTNTLAVQGSAGSGWWFVKVSSTRWLAWSTSTT